MITSNSLVGSLFRNDSAIFNDTIKISSVNIDSISLFWLMLPQMYLQSEECLFKNMNAVYDYFVLDLPRLKVRMIAWNDHLPFYINGLLCLPIRYKAKTHFQWIIGVGFRENKNYETLNVYVIQNITDLITPDKDSWQLKYRFPKGHRCS